MSSDPEWCGKKGFARRSAEPFELGAGARPDDRVGMLARGLFQVRARLLAKIAYNFGFKGMRSVQL